jgi:hypothetical protein
VLNKFEKAAEAFSAESATTYVEQSSILKKNALEKKWTALVKLKLKNSDLETKI